MTEHDDKTWRQWFSKHRLTQLCEFPDEVWAQRWQPAEADRRAAWSLYTEMRTRISTQPLHYRAGIEKTALESIVQLFRLTRELLRSHGPECRHFATVCVEVLNVQIRPFTAKWHKLLESGMLESDDGRHQFRGGLLTLQEVLCDFQRFLALLAEGEAHCEGTESGLRNVLDQHQDLGGAIPYDRLLGLPLAEAQGAEPTEILRAEQQEIAGRRQAAGLASGTDDLVGVAISGGGIRSATFALGVLQGVASKGLLKEVDLLSTVSGGGYVGSFLSSYLNDAPSPADSRPDVGSGPNQLPFRRDEKCEAGPLRFLRNHSKYMLPSGFQGRLLAIGQGLYGVLMNLVILSPLLTGAVLITRYSYLLRLPEINTSILVRMQEMAEFVELGKLPTIQWTHFVLTLGVAAVWGAFVFFLPLVQKLSRLSDQPPAARMMYEKLCVGLFGITLLVAAFEVIPWGYYAFLRINSAVGLLQENLKFNMASFWVLLVNLATFLSARGLLWRPKETEEVSRTQVSLLRKAAFLLLSLAGPILLVVTYFLLCHWLLVIPHVPDVAGLSTVSADRLLWLLFLVPLVYSGFFLNVNLISPQRYYRNRLAETYLLRPELSQHEITKKSSVTAAQREATTTIDPQLLSHLGQTKKAPYHLINAALNIPLSRVPELRGRNSDFFLFSKHYCGSPIVGYHPTRQWEAVDGYLDLGTAMAISGAAASPHMGTATPRGASFFLTLANVRLGYWLRRPAGHERHPFVKAFSGPGPFYLLREMFGRVGEHTKYLNVSDGGHIENLAVYELLRRRCKFIVAIDGECDPGLQFPSMMKLQQYAWIDFGTSLEIDLGRLRLTDRGWSQTHIALGQIHYPTGEKGFLLYIKLSITGNERDYLLDYRTRNSPFPHQSTADQLFDESQFEAYRALGEHVTDDLFCPEFWPGTLVPPGTMRAWFQSLVDNLLDPLPRNRGENRVETKPQLMCDHEGGAVNSPLGSV